MKRRCTVLYNCTPYGRENGTPPSLLRACVQVLPGHLRRVQRRRLRRRRLWPPDLRGGHLPRHLGLLGQHAEELLLQGVRPLRRGAARQEMTRPVTAMLSFRQHQPMSQSFVLKYFRVYAPQQYRNSLFVICRHSTTGTHRQGTNITLCCHNTEKRAQTLQMSF